MTSTMSPEWSNTVAAAVNTADLETAFPGETATIVFLLGKKEHAFKICDGQLRAVSAPEQSVPGAVQIPLNKSQLADLCAGTFEFSSAYMRGEVKPVGSIRALLLTIEVFDDGVVRRNLAAALN